MAEKNITCCFTGHRPDKLPWGTDETAPGAVALKNLMHTAVRSAFADGMRHFICGMATGCDMYFCEAVLALKFTEPSVTLEAAVPFEGQAETWSEENRRRYFSLLRQCDSVCLTAVKYTKDCFIKRNRYMVDCSGRLIAAFNGAPGGTEKTIDYARKKGVEVIMLEITP